MIETDRLIIIPLTHSQLMKYIRVDSSLETELNLIASSRTISPELREALEETIVPNVADASKNYLYSTLWTVISKAENKMVGDLCFVGEPNAEGEIEIGYGTYEEFQNKGFMTEAVDGMIQWAEKQPGVRSMIASTDKSNLPSYAVLIKNKFIKIGETDEMYKWGLTLKLDNSLKIM